MEKGFRLWGTDVTPEYDPYEADIGFAVDLDTDLLGKEAIVDASEDGVDERIVSLVLDEEGAVVDAGHPILVDGEVVGYTCRADYGYSVDAGIAYAYLPSSTPTPADHRDRVRRRASRCHRPLQPALRLRTRETAPVASATAMCSVSIAILTDRPD